MAGIPEVRSVTVSVTVSRELRDVLDDMATAIDRHVAPFPFANPIREIVRLYDSALCPTCGAPNGGGYINPDCPGCRTIDAPTTPRIDDDADGSGT